ncbi:MAG: DEAD/DEAH box helicase family protein [Deltaproteobacteria bacterium]|jgi:type III restriction enzyme|nr:DEAD/DEAH box helicase family protein [Deltaproteobacteria bacterium]
MPFPPDFPQNPYTILEPQSRWRPELDGAPDSISLAPLVSAVRAGVRAWREAGYQGVSETTRALLHWWFVTERPGLKYFFAQREAVESVIWLWEAEAARDPYALLKYDTAGALRQSLFPEDWPRYVLKLATGTGKTKVMSLLLAWSYFNHHYEEAAGLAKNFLIVAPNIIVLDRLALDFAGLSIFQHDPVLPENGYQGREWRADFQLNVHRQDEIGPLSERGNLFLSNVHRLFGHDAPPPSFGDANTADYFLGPAPTPKNAGPSLDKILPDLADLLIFNDEAHHIHDEKLAWFQSLREVIHAQRLRGGALGLQVDLTATPKTEDGQLFVQTVCDYPLVEAIRQGVVKTPVLPDQASQDKLQERESAAAAERYADYIHLGYLEWKKAATELAPTGKHALLFLMTENTRECDEIGHYLAARYPEFKDAVLIIHTKNNGEISEAAASKNKEELEALRQSGRQVDSPESPYRAIVSVMMLREGWDVENVTTIIGLRPFKTKSQILPEQALGRGLRRMFRGQPVKERLSVIGTRPFIQFVENLKKEGVELDYQPMGGETPAKTPMAIEVDHANKDKDIVELDIMMPELVARLTRRINKLAELEIEALPPGGLTVKKFTPEERREIIFWDIDAEAESHRTLLDEKIEPSYHNVLGFYVENLVRELHLGAHQKSLLFGHLKAYAGRRLFKTPLDLESADAARNLAEKAASHKIYQVFKAAINELVTEDLGRTRAIDLRTFRQTRPFLVDWQPHLRPKKSIFNRVVSDRSALELDFAQFLDNCPDIISFIKNSPQIGFRMEYQAEDGHIGHYYPDFLVKENPDTVWIIETKGRMDENDKRKLTRLHQWCEDATALTGGSRSYKAMLVREEEWRKVSFQLFREFTAIFN